MDETERLQAEYLRQVEHARVNAAATERAALEAREGQVWSTDEVSRDFDVLQFKAPFVVVRRLSDGKMGSLKFQHSPRLYFAWQEADR